MTQEVLKYLSELLFLSLDWIYPTIPILEEKNEEELWNMAIVIEYLLILGTYVFNESRKMRSFALYCVIALTGLAFGAEIVSSHVTQSLALLTSAYHMLYNILSLLLLVISHRMFRGKTLTNTFGWARIKVLGLLVNMLFLAALCFAVSVEAVQTMVHACHENTEPRHPRLILVLGALNFLINIVCFLLIGGYTHHQGCSMFIQRDDIRSNCVLVDPVGGVCRGGASHSATDAPPHPHRTVERICWDHRLLDLSRDVSSCLGVVCCGCAILFLDGLILKYADAILALASVIILFSSTYPFVKESGLILLQSIPSHIDVEGLTNKLALEFPDLLNIHDLHIWRLTSSEVIATVHVMLLSPSVYTRIEEHLTHFFREEGISSVTVQPEFTDDTWTEKTKLECILQCSANNNCGALTCCGPMIGHSKPSAARRRLGPSQQGWRKNCGHFADRQTEYDFASISDVTETSV